MKKNEYAFEEDINSRVGSKRQKKSKNKDTKSVSNYFFFVENVKGYTILKISIFQFSKKKKIYKYIKKTRSGLKN